ncbi:MAG: hypothetical protein Q7S79_04020 [bacterium]|nr:hypothetical protein [bacterium]
MKRKFKRYSAGFTPVLIVVGVAIVLALGAIMYFSLGSKNVGVNKPGSVIEKAQNDVVGGPGSALEISWEKDVGSRVTGGSVPFVYKLQDGRVRLYYCSGDTISSSISQDGITFVKEQGIRIASGTGNELIVCDPTIVNLPDGKVRMYYKGADSMNPGPGKSVHKIYSAISTDGLTFQKEGLRIDSETNGDNRWASVPDAIMLPDGRVRLYYVTASEMEHGIGSAISTDGLNFTKEPGLRVPSLVDPALVKFGDKYVIFAASIDERFGGLPKGIYYTESSDGLDFGEPVAVFQENDVYDPTVLKVDENTIRVFYGKVVPPNPPAVESHTGRITPLAD